MGRDPYIQREDERQWDDDLGHRIEIGERADRLAEKGSVSPSAARRHLELLQPASGPIPDLSYQGRVPAPRPTLGFWRRVGRLLWWAGFFALAWIVALACAVTILEVVAWVLDAGS